MNNEMRVLSESGSRRGRISGVRSEIIGKGIRIVLPFPLSFLAMHTKVQSPLPQAVPHGYRRFCFMVTLRALR